MKVRDLMTLNVATCGPETSLADAAWSMWENDCGALPVVSDDKVVGLLTDRDIAMAGATKSRTIRDIQVRDAITNKVHPCRADDEIETALGIMAREQIRRLPVTGADGRIEGMISINDIILKSNDGKSPVSCEGILSVLRAICRHRQSDQKVSPRREAGGRVKAPGR